MKLLSTLILFACSLVVFSQEISNNLIGNFVSKNKKSMYSSIQFMGNGKASINEMDEYEFVERNDSIIVLVDRTVFIFQKNKNNEIKGISDWIDGDVFKSKEKTFQYATNNPTDIKRAELLSEYFDINFKNIFNHEEVDYDNMEAVIQNLKIKNEKLCIADFDLSCIQVFIYKLTESMGGFNAIFNTESQEELKADKNLELEQLGQKIIALGNMEGYGLLSQYYHLINEKEKANEYNTIGLEKGCKICFDQEVNSFLNRQ